MKDKLANILKMARKQIAALICLALALIGIILSFWPTQSWFSQLSDKVGQSIAVGGQVSSLLNKQRHLPSTSLDTNSAQLLPFFPTDDVIQKATAAMGEVHSQSVSILDAASRLNIHSPLVAGVLPNGGDIPGQSFRREYRRATADDARIMSWPVPESQSSRDPIPALKAGRRITDEQIKDALDEATKDINARYADAQGAIPTDLKPQSDADLAAAQRNVPLQKAYEGAQQIKVYVQPGVFKLPAAAANINNAVGIIATGDIWTAQLWLWIDEDIATAVARANASAANVLDSPIKQIDDVAIKDPAYLIVGDPNAGKEDAPLTPAPDSTPTGRVCNGMYDVVQFDIKLDVDARRVPQVLDALQHGQFVTVLDVQTKAIDSAAPAASHFIYGSAPIVQLDVACEELILHNWAAPLTPPDGGTAKYAQQPGGGGGPPPTTFIYPINVHTGS